MLPGGEYCPEMVLTDIQLSKLRFKAICIHCKIEKPIEMYYQRTSVRYDPVCIECRRKERKEKYQAQKQTVQSKRIIEPKIIQNKYSVSNRDTATVVQNSDFNDMEKSYGKMTLNQKHEAVQRFNEFISLLREGYSEMLGCEVYVGKD